MQKTNRKGRASAIKGAIPVIALTLLLILCVIPSFCNIGYLKLQILSPIILSALITLLAMCMKNGAASIALSLNIFLILMIISAVFYQIYLQASNLLNGGFFKGWIYMFYYDKPLIVGLVWLTVVSIYSIKRILRGDNNKSGYIDTYEYLFNIASRGFLIYYVVLLIYCFIFIRGIDSNLSPANFVPFRNIMNYYRSLDTRGYEIFMIFFGNLLLFMPMGFYVKVIKPKTRFGFLLMYPVIISSAIELSQLILKNGNCDIDDVILNAIGFYLGVLLENLIDYFIKRRTNGKIVTIFNWKPSSLFSLTVL